MNYTVSFARRGSLTSRILYTGPSKTEARRSAADALGYRDLRSAYEYTGDTKDGDQGVFYCRRKEAAKEDYDVAIIVAQAQADSVADRAEYDV